MSAGSKIAMGAIILAGAGLAVLGLHDVGAGLINTFNSASHHAASPEAQMMIKGAAVIGGGLVGAIGGGVAGASLRPCVRGHRRDSWRLWRTQSCRPMARAQLRNAVRGRAASDSLRTSPSTETDAVAEKIVLP